MSKLSRKELKLLKERLIVDYNSDCTILSLPDAAFCENGKLSTSYYELLKEEAKFINSKEELTIEVPANRKVTFLPCLKEHIAKEILLIDIEVTKQVTYIIYLYLAAFLIYAVYNHILDTTVLYEMVLVSFWVLNFNAVEKIIFKIPSLKRQERKLLQLASAKIKKYEFNPGKTDI